MEEEPSKNIAVSKLSKVRKSLSDIRAVENTDDENFILKKAVAEADRRRRVELAEKLQKTRAKTLAIDAISGICAAVAVAPGIAIVDQAVTEKTADKSVNLFRSAGANLKSLFVSPIKFVTQPTFLVVCFVYGMTYVTANCITSLCAFNNKDPFLCK
jgi:Na+(H+)/acetate symporter ActP